MPRPINAYIKAASRAPRPAYASRNTCLQAQSSHVSQAEVCIVALCRLLESKSWSTISAGRSSLMTLLEGNDSRMSTQRGRKEAVQAVAAGPLTPIVKAATAGLEVHDDFKQLHEALQAADDTGKGAIVLIEAGWLTNASATAAAQRTHWCRQNSGSERGRGVLLSLSQASVYLCACRDSRCTRCMLKQVLNQTDAHAGASVAPHRAPLAIEVDAGTGGRGSPTACCRM